MSNIDHLFLFSLLFMVFFLFTRCKQKFLNEYFWKITIIPILLYSFILGCRYGWGNDYLFYKYRFENPYGYADEDEGYRLLNLFLNDIGCNYVGAFVAYSLIFIVSAFIWIKDYKENRYMLALFLPATLIFSTFPIRQAVAHSFVFLAFHFLNKKRWLLYFLMIICMYSIHASSVITVFLCSVLFLIGRKVISWKISIPIYVIITLAADIFSSHFFDLFSNLLPYISFENKFQSYIDSPDRWFGADSVNEGWKQGTVTLVLSMLFHISIIYIGYISLKYRPKVEVAYLYNSMLVGFLLLRLFFTVELLRRIANPFIMLYFIPLGYAFAFLNSNIKRLGRQESFLCKVSIFFIIVYLLLYWGRFILQSPDYIFFWNKIV